MKLFAIFSSLYVLKSFLRERAGLDERICFFSNEIKNDNVTREHIMKIQETTEMIDFLELNTTKTEDKLHEVTGRGVPAVLNIFKGGLLSDWNFEFDLEFDLNGLNFNGQ